MTENLETNFLTNSKTVKNLALLTPTERLNMLETMRQLEAKEWVMRFQRKKKNLGQTAALAWWQKTLSDLVKKRGQSAANDLQRRMNDEIRKKG